MKLNGLKVLVTGADGFIGSHLAEALVKNGAEVTALALYNSFDSHGWLDETDPKISKAMRLARGDVRDPHQMTKLCQGQDVIFHLAALIAIPYSYDAPSSYVQTNVLGTLNVLKGALAAGNVRVVVTSTSEVYGTAIRTPIGEDHPLQGQSPYSASKIGADMMAQSFSCSFGLPVIILRPFNTYGERQSERAVISAAVRQMLDDRCQEIRLGDLTPARDFNYVSDTVNAFLMAWPLCERQAGEVFNTGSGRMATIGEMVEMASAIAGCAKPIVHDQIRSRPASSEVMALMADAAKFKAASGWKPKVTLEEGLARVIEWWRPRIGRIRQDSEYML